uniref:Uncharacterized protein n=1 Tax=Fibrocapsa japonica TaxID=94617 RepID=A0A7S2XUZ2_9STRA|mmetsp:Transcript_11606/g.17149  ORF Transcript_11606/g.17149 Transcript_11606/m.17149 type:complete len:149 (+) Transcript_11606:48-494(+)|eukprot:CAMPEP_0113943336 /NCGR_PEP_ID=MMETSP1339-20121228/23193_1 /TAXON_ID=94617 /ORGANISM="Fibrocapsa japonica" /LENGTH=148 /DNA_ID=CAMNT_0000948179 /DNA_START=21 /DNA_END=467 /DNA_ORIENTATION=- /assembly_acc=CAM_ASM_000762
MKVSFAIVFGLALLSSALAFTSLKPAVMSQKSLAMNSYMVSSKTSSFAFAPPKFIQKRNDGRSSIQMGLFGLGAPEIAVCVIVAALVLGPDKLISSARDVGKMAGELKEVPKEFQKGLEEGKEAARLEMAQIKEEATAEKKVEEEKKA